MSQCARVAEAHKLIAALSNALWHRQWSLTLPRKPPQEDIGESSAINRGIPFSRPACAQRSRLPPPDDAVIAVYRDAHLETGHDQTVRLIRSARRQSHSNSASSRRRTCWQRS